MDCCTPCECNVAVNINPCCHQSMSITTRDEHFAPQLVVIESECRSHASRAWKKVGKAAIAFREVSRSGLPVATTTWITPVLHLAPRSAAATGKRQCISDNASLSSQVSTEWRASRPQRMPDKALATGNGEIASWPDPGCRSNARRRQRIGQAKVGRRCTAQASEAPEDFSVAWLSIIMCNFLQVCPTCSKVALRNMPCAGKIGSFHCAETDCMLRSNRRRPELQEAYRLTMLSAEPSQCQCLRKATIEFRQAARQATKLRRKEPTSSSCRCVPESTDFCMFQAHVEVSQRLVSPSLLVLFLCSPKQESSLVITRPSRREAGASSGERAEEQRSRSFSFVKSM